MFASLTSLHPGLSWGRPFGTGRKTEQRLRPFPHESTPKLNTPGQAPFLELFRSAVPKNFLPPFFGLWPKAIFTVAWGTPQEREGTSVVWPKAIFTALPPTCEYGLWPKRPDDTVSWGVAPGYGGSRPSAKLGRTVELATSKTKVGRIGNPSYPEL